MKTKPFAAGFIVGLIWLLSGCNYARNVAALTAGKLDAPPYPVSIPFQFESGLIVVPVPFEPSTQSYSCLLDSGAFNSKIETGLAEAQGFQSIAFKDNQDSQGNVRKIEVVRIGAMQLGPLHLKKIGAGKLNWDEKAGTRCFAPGGIIGANVMKLANWQIDFEQRTIAVSGAPFVVGEGAIRLPFTHPLLSGTPEITIAVGGREVSPVVLDLGSNGSLRLPYALHAQFPDVPTVELADQSNAGIYGVSADPVVVKLLPIQLGDQTYSLPVTFEGEGGKGLLGTEILQFFRVTLNYDGNQIFLEPTAQAPVASPTLTFIPGVSDEGHWVVRRAARDSQWSLGDPLREVNEHVPDELFHDYCEYFRGIGALLRSPEGLRVTTQSGVQKIDPLQSWDSPKGLPQ